MFKEKVSYQRTTDFNAKTKELSTLMDRNFTSNLNKHEKIEDTSSNTKNPLS